ncbi:MAG: cysteine hydrolase family protein [Bacteroidales bacterium]
MKKLRFVIIFVITLITCMSAFSQNYKSTINNKALLIIDIQMFYFHGGSVPLVEPEKAAQNAAQVLNYARNNNILVIHIKHNSNSGSEIHQLVSPIVGEKVISKDEANAFNGTDLLDYLKERNIEELIITGMQTHMCVEAATRAAYDFGFTCTVIEDACATRDLKFKDKIIKAEDVHYSTLSALNRTYAKILTTEEFIK